MASRSSSSSRGPRTSEADGPVKTTPRAACHQQPSIASLQQHIKLHDRANPSINAPTGVQRQQSLSRPRPNTPTAKRNVKPEPPLIPGNQEVTMLKEQLAKLQSELRIARGQGASPDSQPTPRSKTPPAKTANSLNSSQRHHQHHPQHPHHHHHTHPPTQSSHPSPTASSPKSRKKSLSVSRTRTSRKSSSSANSEPTDGLSIRFISGPGILASRPPHPSSIMDDSRLPITDSGYIKDAAGVWVPLNGPPLTTTTTTTTTTHPASPNLSSSTRYKPQSPSEPPRALSRIPISAVALGRVLAGDPLVCDHQSNHSDIPEEHEPVKEASGSIPQTSGYSSGASVSSPLIDDSNGTPSSEPSGSQLSAVSRQPRGNPFFSSGGGRDRGAMIHQHSSSDRATNGGNTGKVITTLQSDLLYARTALDQSKSQLRLSQRAVESLNRQTEDLKESMSRLRLENEGLSKMLSRKERTVSELMDRLKRSEGELSTLKQEKKELDGNFKKISKETDEIVKDSVRRRDRAETQYEAVRSGVKSLSEGWKRDVTTLKQDIGRLEEKHRKEMEDSRLKYNTLAKLHASRSGALSRIETDLNSLQSSKEGFIAKYSSELSVLKAHLEDEEKKSSEGLQLAREVSDECARFKRILRTHSDAPSSSSRPTTSKPPQS